METKIFRLIPDERENYFKVVADINDVLFESWVVFKRERICEMFNLTMEEVESLIHTKQ